jgi:hypothetical protein
MKFRVKISADRNVTPRDPPPPLKKQKNLIRSHDPDFFLRFLTFIGRLISRSLAA